MYSCEADVDIFEQRLEEALEQLCHCTPSTSAATEVLSLADENGEPGALLNDAVRRFTEAMGGAEGSESTLAFVQKHKPI